MVRVVLLPAVIVVAVNAAVDCVAFSVSALTVNALVDAAVRPDVVAVSVDDSALYARTENVAAPAENDLVNAEDIPFPSTVAG